ncbi:hypothetical protein [Candidatus Spongiihabitans sp.]|uniref:hypothetical protein n=1 Tax=Candidatus Spongiihabitans sp. TaxID=3101308 RepID=UPI003C704AD0
MGKFSVESGSIDLAQVTISLAHVGDALQSQLLGQSALVRPEGAFRTPSGFGRIGFNHLDAQSFHGFAKLG